MEYRLLSFKESSSRASSVIYVANKTQIFRLDPFPLSVQIEQLVSSGAYDDALLFTELVDSQDLPDKVRPPPLSALN